MNTWLNIIGYQAVWLVAVRSAGHGATWPAWAAWLLFAAWQLARGHGARADVLLMPVVALAGGAMDSLLAATGLVRYAAPLPSPHLAPLWILAIWLSFALTLRHGFAFLRGRPGWAALLGATGGPLAYWSAAHGWNAVQFPLGTWPALAALAVLWAPALPLLIALARRIDVRASTRRDAHA